MPQALFNFGPSIKLHSYFIKLNPFLLRSRFYDGSLCRASELLVCSKRPSEVIELPKKTSQFVCFVLDFLPPVLCFDRNVFAEIGRLQTIRLTGITFSNVLLIGTQRTFGLKPPFLLNQMAPLHLCSQKPDRDGREARLHPGRLPGGHLHSNGTGIVNTLTSLPAF